MGEVEPSQGKWPTDRPNQGWLVQVNDQRLDLCQSSSAEKLPSIRACKPISPFPRRKMAIVGSSSAKGEKVKSTDLPPLLGCQSSERQKVEGKRSLSISVSPSVFRKYDAHGREGKKKLRNVNLQPIIPKNRASLPVSPFQRRQLLSPTENSRQLYSANEVYYPGKSISLEDITLESRRSEDDEEKDVVLGKEGRLWSRHWYFARKSIGAVPQEKDFLDMEILNNAFTRMSRPVKSPEFAGDVAMYGSQEPDVMSNEKVLDASLTLEERLASIEKQQGLSTKG